MANVRYTRQILADAAAASTSMAGVLRHLGLRQTGGAHAHLRRRIDHLGIDTTHFLGQGHARNVPPRNRRRPEEVMILRPLDAKREVPRILRRALTESGRPYLCSSCGIGDTWHGQPLTLQVDHIDGRFWDCRAENLRFLCPNCHSQTATFAGRHRVDPLAPLVQVDENGDPIASLVTEPLAITEQEKVVNQVANGELGASAAAKILGCKTPRVYKMLERLRAHGTLETPARRAPIPETGRTAIVAFALAHPELGAKRIAAAFTNHPDSPIDVTATMVGYILAKAGLASRSARLAASR
ncbi:HNH endonuclease signature motif containing protein [Actinoplanes sp. NPDC051494]|uniref:HNH endonuclease signature motif containing protein n=1 Tax=Actinoplanes sp. NPDC051494 TaxID=3363907 RepID=UPI0037A67330